MQSFGKTEEYAIAHEQVYGSLNLQLMKKGGTLKSSCHGKHFGIRYNEGDNLVWGANFVRTIIRKNEKDIWRFVPLYAGVEGQERISQAGDATGLMALKWGVILILSPL